MQLGAACSAQQCMCMLAISHLSLDPDLSRLLLVGVLLRDLERPMRCCFETPHILFENPRQSMMNEQLLFCRVCVCARARDTSVTCGVYVVLPLQRVK